MTTDTDHYSFRQPLLQREERNDDFLFGMKAWDLLGNARFFIEVTVCDVYPGLTTEEALIGIRNMDSSAASVRLKCNDMESASACPASASACSSLSGQTHATSATVCPATSASACGACGGGCRSFGGGCGCPVWQLWWGG